jgi:hypothetical protein
MRIARIAAVVVLVFMCARVQAAPQSQTKMAVTGTLARAMAIGGESTGWSIQVDPEITVDGKRCIRSKLGTRTRKSWSSWRTSV